MVDGLDKIASITGGLFALLGLVLAILFAKNPRRSPTPAGGADVGHVSQFSVAVEQVGSEEPSTRLVGAHALVHLADSDPEVRQLCVDVLCAYLRMPVLMPEDSQLADEIALRRSIFKLISARLRPGAHVDWQGLKFDFTRARVDGCDFSGVALATGTTLSFREAAFVGGVTDFQGLILAGGTLDFRDCDFLQGRVDFRTSSLVSGVVSFRGAAFRGAEVTFRKTAFAEATVDFRSAAFSDGELDFSGALFVGGTVDFRGADFRGSLIDMSNVAVPRVLPIFDRGAQDAEGVFLPSSFN